jgi:hypothetical protein
MTRFPESTSKETLISADQRPQDPKRICQRPRLVFVTSKICDRVQVWPPHRSLICSETTAKTSIHCINCSSSHEGQWHGRIIGKGACGSIKALLIRIKYKYTGTPLIGLITICPGCCKELELYNPFDQMDHILSFRDFHNTPRNEILGVSGNVIIGVSHKEMDELFFSKVITLEGAFTTPFRTAGPDGQWKVWNQLRDG